MRPSLILLYSLLVLTVLNLQAQQLPPDVKTFSRNGSTIEIKSAAQKNGRPVNNFIVEAPKQQVDALSGERRVLIKFKTQPLAQRSSRNSSAVSRSINEEHSRFLSDLQQLTSHAKGAGRIEQKVLGEFKTVFNGYALIIPAQVEDAIRKLPYVASVVEDQQVEAIDESSNQVIKADQVWANLNITGRGVVIGIIDSGIDYNHTDLGGGIGSSFKVLGGYDFVNDDNDPLDDNGHGTHVAGIAAANGSIKGVAPDAKLMAFKVLDAAGYGWDSWIIASIERSVDPDQNPATNDAVDIVNMSLGRASRPNDPYTEAIANATALGVTFVVAAGNSRDYFTVRSPGVAPDAITVGATDLSDITASFSSKGPTEFDYLIKPDVSAPGVEINSTILQNQYAQFNGTSMASPHVAGAAALLLEKNPSWTPEMIKASLMNNAKPGDAYWTQGAGRIDALKSIQSAFIVTPGSISLGRYNELQPEQKIFKTTIYNTSDEVKEFFISANGDIINSHVSVQIQPSTATLTPGESREITVTFNTSTGLPYKHFTEGYYGELVVSSEGKDVHVPVAMINAKITRLIFSTPLPNLVYVLGINGSGFSRSIFPTAPVIDVIIPEGQVDIIATYGSQNNVYVIKEAVNGTAGEDIQLTKDLAKNKIVFAFNDKDDNPITIDMFNDGVALFQSRSLTGSYGFPVDTFYVSDNTIAKFDFLTRDRFSNTFYDLSAGVAQGQHEDVTIIKKADVKFKIDIDNHPNHQWQFVSYGEYESGLGFLMWNRPVECSNTIELYAVERKPTDFFTFSKAVFTEDNGDVIETGLFKFKENDIVEFKDVLSLPNVTASYTSTDFTYDLGRSLLRWNGRMVNQTNHIALYDFPSTGIFNYALNERNHEELDYELRSNGQLMSLGKIPNGMSLFMGSYDPLWQTSVSPDTYSLSVISIKHQVNEVQGFGRIDLDFDTRKDDKDPPNLTFFNLYREGITTNTIFSGEQASIVIGLSDCNIGYNCYSSIGFVTAKLFIMHDVGTWQELELTNLTSDTLVANIDDLPEGYYSTSVIAVDLAGNKSTYTLSPAFFVGPAGGSPTARLKLLQPSNYAADVERYPVFTWENIGAVSYTFELSKSPSFTTIESTVTLAENQLTLPVALDYSSMYYWRVKPNYPNSSGLWSDRFDFKTIDFKTILISPENQSRESNLNFVHFAWEEFTNAQLYHIQVSRSPDFTSMEYENAVQEPFVASSIIPEDGVTYYWRVESYYNGVFGQWSDVFSFTGDLIPLKVQLSYPLNNSEIETRKPPLLWSYAPLSVSYTLQISRDADFTQLEVVETSEFLTPALSMPLSSAGTYHWRVRANYEGESGEWSDVFQFTIREYPLALVQPEDNSLWVSAERVFFVWEHLNYVSRYHFQVSKNPQFSSIEYETEQSATMFEWPTFSEPDQVYYWRVRPYYAFEYYGDWSETFSFTGQSDNYVTSLVWPENNSINVERQPDFDWLRSGYAHSYTFQISKTADFSSVDHEVSTLGNIELPELDFSTKYYWRVRAHYENETKPWSDIFTFRVEDLFLTLTSPEDQSVQTSSSIHFEWNQLNNVTQYHFQLSKDVEFNSVEHEEEVDDPMYPFASALESNSTYFWRVRPYYNLDYFGEWSATFAFITDIVTSLPEQADDSKKAIAYPNPFNTGTTVEFYLARAGDVSLEMLNPQGQVIDRLTKFFPLGGRQSLHWKGNDIVPGVYLCKITSAGKTEVVKLIRSK